jgi:hypothetical protein
MSFHDATNDAKRLVCKVRAESWEDARTLSQLLARWAFRGQADVSWGLSNCLERAAFRSNVSLSLLKNRENWMLTQFQRRAHHYFNDLPTNSCVVEWLAMIQHYGGPTRLVDFTYSFYVAAFFALEFATTDVAVWAINLFQLEGDLREKIGVQWSSGDTLYSYYQRLREVAEEFITGNREGMHVMPVEPDRLNERLSIQQGLFLLPTSLANTFECNLAATYGVGVEAFKNPEDVAISDLWDGKGVYDYAAIKIVLPLSARIKILDDLWSMNINSATLFPGLDGFARSLNFHMKPPR